MSQPHTRPEPTASRDDLTRILRWIPRTFRFWKAGLLSTVLAAAAFAGALQVLPKEYRSESVVYYQEGLQWRSEESMSARRVGQRFKDMLLARAQLAKVIEELGLFPGLVKAGKLAEAVEEMRLKADLRSSQGDVYVVSYVGTSAEEAQRVAAKLTDVLITEHGRLRFEHAEQQRQFLDAEKRRMEAAVAEKEAAQVRFLAVHPEFAQEGSAGVGASLRAPRQRAGGDALSGGGALAALRREEQRLRRQLQSGGEIPAAPGPSAELAAAEAKLREAQRELTDRRSRFTERHPDVLAAASRVAEAEAVVRRLAAENPAGATPAPPPVSAATLQERLASVTREISDASRQPEPTRVMPVGAGSEAAKRIVALETEWTRLSREVTEARERLQRLDAQQFSAAMTSTMLTSGQTGQIVKIDPAYLPASPIGLAPKKKLLAGLAAALGLGLLLMAGRALFDDLILGTADVARHASAPVLAELGRKALPGGRSRPAPGAVPRPRDAGQGAAAFHAAAAPARGALVRGAATALSARPELVSVVRMEPPRDLDPRLVMLADPDGPAAASFRILRHRLAARGAEGTLLVSSPAAGEGKTLVAANLALAMGEARRSPVLLVDANPRAPALAGWFGVRPPLGLGEQLQQHADRAEAPWIVAEPGIPYVHLLALDPEGERPRIDGRGLAACLAQLRRAGYEHVVIDGPQVLGGADANVIDECVDAVLMVLRCRRSRGGELARATEQLGTAKLQGLVLLGT